MELYFQIEMPTNPVSLYVGKGDSRHFKLLHSAFVSVEGGLKKPYHQTDCVGMAESDIIRYARGGATTEAKVVFISDSCREQ